MSVVNIGEHIAAIEESTVDRIQALRASMKETIVGNNQTLQAVMASTSSFLSATEIQGFWPEPGSWLSSIRPYNVQGGILQVPVQGVLVSGCSITYSGWITGYTYIEQAVLRAQKDPDVSAIQLVVDSPGGDTIQLYELCDTLRSVAETKKIFTTSTGMMCSAAYMIGCMGNPMYVPRVSQTGSIGVISVHTDLTQANKMAGKTVTIVSSPKGGRKAELNSATTLSDQAKAGLQALSDEIYDLFVSYVSTQRPNLTVEDVVATQGAFFGAKESLAQGLVDKVMDFQLAVDDFTVTFLDPDPDNGDPIVDYNAETQAAAVNAALEKETPAIKAQGASEERTRIKAILESDTGKARPKAAMAYALTQSGDAEQAVAFLGMLPEEKPESAPQQAADTKASTVDSAFNAAMNQSAHPNAGPLGTQVDDKTELDARIEAAVKAVGV